MAGAPPDTIAKAANSVAKLAEERGLNFAKVLFRVRRYERGYALVCQAWADTGERYGFMMDLFEVDADE